MKICHISDYLPKYHERYGGAEMAAYRLMNIQKKKGYEVSSVTISPDNEVGEFENHSVRLMEGRKNRLVILRWLKQGLIPYDPLVYKGLIKILEKIRPDVVHIHNCSVLSFAAVSAAKKLGIKVVFSIYDYWIFCPKSILHKVTEKGIPKWYSHRENNLFDNMLFRFRNVFFNYFVRKIDAFIVLSENSGKILENFGISDDKIFNVPLVFDLEDLGYEKKHVKNEKPSILYTGWIVRHKGLHILIKSLIRIKEKYPNIVLNVIGNKEADKSYTEYIKEMINKFDLKDNVNLLDKMPYEKVKEYFNMADIVAIPEQWENMSPVVMIECMLFEKTIVASKIGGIPEFIKHKESGFLADHADSGDFAEKITYALDNKEESSRVGRYARQKALGIFDEGKVLKKIEEVYRQVK